jgi:hypothetical protein
MSKLVTSGTGHDRCPSPARAHQAPGHHRMVATKKLGKPVLVSRDPQNFLGHSSLLEANSSAPAGVKMTKVPDSCILSRPTITLEAKACLTSLSCRKAKELGYPHELWTTRLLARHAREHGPAEGHPCLANTKMAVARVAAPDWSCAGSRGGDANPHHRASGCRRHTAGLRHRACASAGH